MSSGHMRYAPVLSQCRDIVVIFSNSQLSELFENAGAALLDFAERAQNNSIQGRFFEAMGLIQRRRPDIEQAFRREVNNGFENFGNLDPPSHDPNKGDAFTEGLELSLVAPEEMEESVASENLIIKANASCFPELYALSQRLTVLNEGNKLRDYEIPAGPHHLVHSFRRSIKGLDVEVNIKVILYALFDKFVMKQAKGLYNELNGSLKAAGILPNLKPVHVRTDQSKARGGGKAKKPQPAGKAPPGGTPEPPSLGVELFDSILELMSTQGLSKPGSARRKAGGDTPASYASGGAPSPQLMAAVEQIQSHTTPESVHSMIAEAAEIPNLEVDTVFIERVKDTLNQERVQVLSQVDSDKLSPMDADLIDLIGMLFEYMLNDPVLPNLAKALLSHLHTPYLKVALIDRRLLVDASHPARKLLDQMVEAGSLWVDEKDATRGIFPSMQKVVDRVLQEFSNDVALFEELLAFFEQGMREQQRRTDTMEQRTQEVARGREKLLLAKRRATHQIQALLERAPLPPAVSSFLEKTWLDRLVFILLREKQEDRSDIWKRSVQIAEELTALFDPRLAAAEQRARIRAIPKLRVSITEGVQHMGTSTHAALESLFSVLADPKTWQARRPEPAAPQRPARTAVAPAGPDKAAAAAQKTPSASEPEISAKEKEVIQRLRKMKLGTWFEFGLEAGSTPRRIKLSWLSPLTSTCMFVDRSGMQAEIKTLHELAREILAGRAKVIQTPKHPFIERALVSIRKMLQGDEKRAPAKAS